MYFLTEIHIMLLRTLLREKDSKPTHFRTQDGKEKDSVNVSLYFVDSMPKSGVLRSYVQSDRYFDQNILKIQWNCDYPLITIRDMMKFLQFLHNEFLILNSVQEDLLQQSEFLFLVSRFSFIIFQGFFVIFQ